jgi:hypothetical protein
MQRFSFAVASLVVVVVLFAAMFAGMAVSSTPAAAAPAAIPTPVSVTRPGSEIAPITFNPFAGDASITADTTSTCYDVGKFAVVDVLYVIDQTIANSVVNTTTLTSKWSIDGTITASGVNVVASNAADATDIAQLQVFGRYFCILADVSNTNPVTVTAQVIAK